MSAFSSQSVSLEEMISLLKDEGTAETLESMAEIFKTAEDVAKFFKAKPIRSIKTYPWWAYKIPQELIKLRDDFDIPSRILRWKKMGLKSPKHMTVQSNSWRCNRCQAESCLSWGEPPFCSTCSRVFECAFCHDISVGDDRKVKFGKVNGKDVVVECPYCRNEKE